GLGAHRSAAGGALMVHRPATASAGDGALDGLRVLELGYGVAGAVAARLLGDLGADVVKVERPGAGDPLRAEAPVLRRGHGALFELLNLNKRGIALDLGDR